MTAVREPTADAAAEVRTDDDAPLRRHGDIVNAMSVDVEDYFQVQAFASQVKRGDWDSFDSRVERNTDRVLQVYDDTGIQATFFTLGWVAERHPELIRRIVGAGHELASHGFEHIRVFEQTPEAFRADVRRTKSLLEDVGGVTVPASTSPLTKLVLADFVRQ